MSYNALKSVVIIDIANLSLGPTHINRHTQAGLLVEPTLTKTKQVSELLEIAQEGRFVLTTTYIYLYTTRININLCPTYIFVIMPIIYNCLVL